MYYIDFEKFIFGVMGILVCAGGWGWAFGEIGIGGGKWL